MKNPRLIDLAVLVLIFLFFFSYFEPQYLFSLTTTTGGDTGSHYPTAVFLKEVLLPGGNIMGWDMGNYAGYPLFYHYFPFSFLVNVLISFIIPMQVAFKITTVLGTFLLPVCVYLAFRLLAYPFPLPIMGAAFSLAFLFMEANSMWGGNIPSTLAGEYSYSLSLSLVILLFGSLYHGVNHKKHIVFNALLIAAIGLSHGFTFISTGVIGSYFLWTRKEWWPNFKYLFLTYGLAFLLIAFWLLPFYGNLPWVTTYVTRWGIGSILEVIPLILLPFALLAFIAFFLNLFDKRTWYFGYCLLMFFILYWLAPSIGMLDIRWVPFLQLFTVLLAATFLLGFLNRLQSIHLIPLIALLAVCLWVVPNTRFIKSWVKWNYEGFEKKATWPIFKGINDYLQQGGGGRVVYEHSPLHNAFGTERAFENLPYFAKRNTLEGLYMQSSVSSPFIFYIQSEVSKVCSGPFPQYKYTSLNVPAALPHLKLFNVTEYIVRTPETKKQVQAVPELKLEKTFGEYEIYRLTINDGHYVVPVKEHPVVTDRHNWKNKAYDWFRSAPVLEAPLPGAQVTEKIGQEEIWFKTNYVGKPHLIKISYHPNWQVIGADKIYLAYPSFMLVYPTQPEVKLYFGKTVFNRLGAALTFLGLTIILASGIISITHARKS